MGDLFFQVPMSTEEVARCFSEQQEGSLGDWQKELCKQIPKGSQETLGSLGKKMPAPRTSNLSFIHSFFFFFW
jgi:hypothetical protein